MAIIRYEWNGEAMIPRPAFRKRCDEEFVVHKVYRLEVVEERSQRSHNHFFACLNEAWKNLPENLADEYPTTEHLRKRALIKAGYRNERRIVCESPEQAERLSAMVYAFDEFAVVLTEGPLVVVLTAQSQSARSMGKKTFQESKTRVLDLCADLIRTTREELERNAGRAA